MIKHDSVFFKLLMLSISLTVAVSFIIATSSTMIAEKLLLRQIISSSSVNLNYIENRLLDYNTEVVSTIYKISSSQAFKNYLTLPISTATDHFSLICDLGKYLDTIKDDLTPKGSHIRISGNNSMYYTSNSLNWDQEMDNVLEEYMTVNNIIPNKILYHNNTYGFKKSFPYKNSIFATKPLIDNITQEMYGYVLVIINETILHQMYSQYVSPGISISIVSSDGSIWSSSNRDVTGTEGATFLGYAQNIMENNKSYTQDMRDGKHYTIMAQYLPFYDAYIIQEIDKSLAFSEFYQLKYYIFGILLIVVFITIVTVYFISKKITKPLIHVVDVMANLTGKNLNKQHITVTGGYETQMLASTYNNMLEVIDNYMKNLIQEQEDRRKAELNALQMQIHPHFLYNTLSSIKYLAKSDKIEQVENTIHSLISILQNTIGTTDEMITLRQEIENLYHYIYINQMRYGEFIKVDFNIPEEFLDAKIPKLTIQPFVENAFFHAFNGKQSGNINIFVRAKDRDLIIEVIDNGTGIKQSQLETLTTNKKYHVTGIGIYNVDERLKLLYGNQYGIAIRSDLGFGTCVTITIPKC